MNGTCSRCRCSNPREVRGTSCVSPERCAARLELRAMFAPLHRKIDEIRAAVAPPEARRA